MAALNPSLYVLFYNRPNNHLLYQALPSDPLAPPLYRTLRFLVVFEKNTLPCCLSQGASTSYETIVPGCHCIRREMVEEEVLRCEWRPLDKHCACTEYVCEAEAGEDQVVGLYVLANCEG